MCLINTRQQIFKTRIFVCKLMIRVLLFLIEKYCCTRIHPRVVSAIFFFFENIYNVTFRSPFKLIII